MAGDTNGMIEVGHGSWWAKFSGRGIIAIAINVIGFAAVVLVLYDHERDSAHRQDVESIARAERDAKRDAEIAMRQNAILENQVKILTAALASLEEQKNQTYILSLSERDRTALNLAMPPSLAERRVRGIVR
jgi:hypothetical protein